MQQGTCLCWEQLAFSTAVPVAGWLSRIQEQTSIALPFGYTPLFGCILKLSWFSGIN
jgi:hypothetical protein